MLTLLDQEDMPEIADRLTCSPQDEAAASSDEATAVHFCAACRSTIRDRFYLQTGEGSYWHAGCLRCAACHVALDQEVTCYAKHGLVYCKRDYVRIFKCGLCARCGLKIDTNELVMRVHSLVYHLSCFACATCNRQLNTGEVFGLQEGIVYCREDYDILLQTVRHHRLADPYCAEAPPAFYNGTGAVQKGRPRKKRMEDAMEDFDGRSDEYSLNSPPRQKRMRTSFKHHQIRTMKAYFNLNHNPDAKDLKQLAEKTGLSKRVLQVWFQNARAKYRRSVAKQEPGIGSSSSGLQSARQQSGDTAGDTPDDIPPQPSAASNGDTREPSPAFSDGSSEYVDFRHEAIKRAGDDDSDEDEEDDEENSGLDENSNSMLLLRPEAGSSELSS